VDKVINVPVMSVSENEWHRGLHLQHDRSRTRQLAPFAQGSRFGAGSLAEIYGNSLIATKWCFN